MPFSIAPALKPARQRLNGKVLRIVLKEFSTPLVLVFSERQLDVLGRGKVRPTARSLRT
jgi:ubiquinone biosynthesis protein UbiJ